MTEIKDHERGEDTPGDALRVAIAEADELLREAEQRLFVFAQQAVNQRKTGLEIQRRMIDSRVILARALAAAKQADEPNPVICEDCGAKAPDPEAIYCQACGARL